MANNNALKLAYKLKKHREKIEQFNTSSSGDFYHEEFDRLVKDQKSLLKESFVELYGPNVVPFFLQPSSADHASF